MASPITIDKGVPLPKPARGGGGGRPPKYPYATMVVGDSFFAPINCNFGGTTDAQKRHGIALATRKVTENGVRGVRVWRVT